MKFAEMIYNGEISGVYTDTRKKFENALFVPIKGENFDGNDFVINALQSGNRSLVERDYYEKHIDKFKDWDVYIVDDALDTLWKMAFEYRKLVNPFTIGITGSIGKTTTKGMLFNVLKLGDKKVVANVGNLNNTIGLPLTILNSPKDTEIFVLEMGLMKKGDIKILADIARPDMILITNIESSHMKYFKNHDEVYEEKLSSTTFFYKDNTLILNSFDRYLGNFSTNNFKLVKTDIDDYEVKDLEDGYIEFSYKDIDLNPGIRGRHIITNIMLVVEACKKMGIDEEVIVKGINSFTGESMRFTQIDLPGIRIINDAYNANSVSIIAAIKTFCRMDAKRKIAIIGDILELDKLSEEEHLTVAKLKELEDVDMVLTLGKYSRVISDRHKNGKHFEDIYELSDYLMSKLQNGDSVLIKGSRGLQMERIVNVLEEKWS